jgi:hypothetical protein
MFWIALVLFIGLVSFEKPLHGLISAMTRYYNEAAAHEVRCCEEEEDDDA